MGNNNNKISKKVLWTRIFCAFLAFLMVAGVATMGITLLVSTLGGADTEQSDSHEGHNH